MMKMTKVTVTALKAPWPDGAQVGHVVAFVGEPPAWALGKFTLAAEDADPDFTYEPAPPANVGAVVDDSLTITPVQQRELADRFETLERERSGLLDQITAQGQTIEQLTADLHASVQESATLREQLGAAQDAAAADKARADDLQAKLTAAEKAAADAATPKSGKK